jgi:L-aminopeptidase/D-esterase-like protein
VRDPATGKIVAGARKTAGSREFLNSDRAMMEAATPRPSQNTTLTVVATNAKLSKVGAQKLAQFASLGVARAISPVNTSFDGDTTFALSIGDAQANLNALGSAAAEAAARAIVRAVQTAKTMGGLPGLAG